MKRYIITIVYLLLGTTVIGSAQTPDVERDSIVLPQLPSGNGMIKVQASTDCDSIVVGDPVELKISVEGVGSTPIRFPSLEELSQNAVEALSMKMDTVKSKKQGVSRIEQTVRMTSFEAGNWPIVVLIAAGDSLHPELFMPEDSLVLHVSLLGEADTNDIHLYADAGRIKEPYTFGEIARWVLLGLLVGAIVAAIVWYLRMRKAGKQKKIVEVFRKPVPADKRALTELEALRRKELWQKGKVKRYYTELTDIVRRYLENLCGMKASEMTTRQTLRAFRRTEDYTAETETLLKSLLEKADMVKFAKSQPESFEHNEAMQQAEEFIKKLAQQHAMNHQEEEKKK